MVRVHEVLGSPPGIALGVAIARLMPRPVGYWLAQRIARSMARRRTYMFVTVRDNLARVVGRQVGAEALDAMAERAIACAGRTYFDMFRARRSKLVSGRVALRIDAEAWARAKALMEGPKGVVVVGPHIGNFDLAAQWFAAQGIEIQALSLPDPNLGTRVLNWLRRRRGMVVTPVSVLALRQAVARLRRGGVVLTGIDRPVQAGDTETLTFFGAPARLPTGHVRLALQTGAYVLVACCRQEEDGGYRIEIAPPLQMESTGAGRDGDVRHNARRVLAIAEEMIRHSPEQWLMFVPVWDVGTEPEAADPLAPPLPSLDA